MEEAIKDLDQSLPSECNTKTSKSARRSASLQPVLFRSQGRYFIKVDRTAIPVTDASCFAEAAEFLFMSCFVFWVEYPYELRIFYTVLEQLVGIKSAVKSTILSDFNPRLQRYFTQEDDTTDQNLNQQ